MKQLLKAPVIVAALGYFVDIYDLLLFNIVRVPSLQSIGLHGQELKMGLYLNNTQMTGMMIGGVMWGILGDKRGRLSVLFGSIFIYSAANLANAYVTTFQQYAFLRFVAGLGLAGELGAGITLVSEIIPKHMRGLGTMFVATVGVSGAVVAALLAEVFTWRTCYIIGGVLGLLLLLLRIGVSESGMFDKLKSKKIKRGNFFQLFIRADRRLRYFCCILIGIPIWYIIGILVAYAPEFSNAIGVVGNITSSRAIMFCYSGLILGDFSSGYLSQLLESRRKSVAWYLVISSIFVFCYLFMPIKSEKLFYGVCFGLGIAAGYWAVLVTIAVEQFGTDLRATAGTTVPNFVRGSVVPMSLAFLALKPFLGLIWAAAAVGIVVLSIASISLFGLQETFGRDLDFTENT